MGWKTLKERFGVDRHILHVTDEGICIGSDYVYDLLVVDPKTGLIRENSMLRNFGAEVYPLLMHARPADILSALKAQDTFKTSIPVFTYKGSEILEKCCEATGYPNVTHDGCLMHDNCYSTDRNKVIEWAKRSAASRVNLTADHIARLEADLNECRARLAAEKRKSAELEHL